MITPKRLFLDGWLSYDKETIDLSTQGITYVWGAIGSGKSAIPEAIYYLLYGKTLRGKDSVNDLVNKVLDDGYDIGLELDIHDVAYRIQEIRGRTGKGLYFYRGDKDLRGKTDPETRKRIIETLGMSDRVFQSIGFLGQNQTQVLVSGTPGERGKALVDIYALDVYDQALGIISTDLTHAKNGKAAEERTLAQLTSDIAAIKETITEDIPEDDFDGKVEKISAKITKAKTKITKLRELSNTLIAQISKQKSLRDQQKRLKDLEAKIAARKKELCDMKKPERDMEELKAELRSLNKQQVLVVAAVTKAKREIADAKQLVNTCPITDTECPVDVPKKHKDTIISRCRKVIDENTTKEKQTEIDIEALEYVKQDASAYHKLKNTIDLEENNLKAIRPTDKVQGTEEAEEKLAKCRSSLSVGSDKVDSLQEDREDVLSRKAAYGEVQGLKHKLERMLASKSEDIDGAKKQLLEHDNDIMYLTAAAKTFKKAKLYKIDIVLELLNKNIRNILDVISDGEYSAEFVSQKKAASSERLLDKISIVVHDNYKSMPIELWSGGQKTEVGLAVLLSVWKTATDIADRSVSCLWLDEVFGPLDRDIIDRVFSSVMDVAGALGTTSVKVISHRDLDARLFDETWEINQDAGISYLTVT